MRYLERIGREKDLLVGAGSLGHAGGGGVELLRLGLLGRP